MGTVYFTSNPADYETLEQLYITEKSPPGFVRGADLSVTGIFTKTTRGPLTPQIITSVARMLEVYGPRDVVDGGALYNELYRCLLGKPFGTLVVRRVAAAAAAASTLTLSTFLKIDASSVGVWGNGLTAAVENASNGDANMFNLRIKWRSEQVLYENLNIFSTADNLLVEVGEDVGRLITLTKLLPGRPVNAAAASLTGGTDGTLAATDYVSGLADIAAFRGISSVICPESLESVVTSGAQATLNAAIVTAAPQAVDRVFMTWDGLPANTPAQTMTALNAQITSKSDRIVWGYNAAKVLDSATGLNVECGPHVFLASVRSQNDVDVHAGSTDAKKQLAGIRELRSSTISRGDLVLLRARGVSTLVADESFGGLGTTAEGFSFQSVVTTDLTPGKTELTRRVMADFILLSLADRLRFYVKQKNTIEKRAQMQAECIAFLSTLKSQNRVVENFAILEGSTKADRSRGIEKIILRVDLVDHLLHLVLEAEIGTGVVIEA